MNTPRDRPRMLRDEGGLHRGRAAPKPNHLHGMVHVVQTVLYPGGHTQ